jgi:hypothetical protein
MSSMNNNLALNTLDELFQFVEAAPSLDQLTPNPRTGYGIDILTQAMIITVQWLNEAWPILSTAQVNRLMVICEILTFHLKTAPFYDFVVYDCSRFIFRVIWFQTNRCIGLFDRLTGVSHLFPREQFWAMPIRELVRRINVSNRLEMENILYSGIGSVQAKFEVVKRAFQLQAYWYTLRDDMTDLDHTTTIFMTEVCLNLPTLDGPSPGHPDRRRALWHQYEDRIHRHTLPDSITSPVSALRFANLVAIHLTLRCSKMGFRLAKRFSALFPRFRPIFYEGFVAIEDALTEYIHFFPMGTFFEKSFDFVHAVQTHSFLDPELQRREPFWEWMRTANKGLKPSEIQRLVLSPYTRRFFTRLISELNTYRLEFDGTVVSPGQKIVYLFKDYNLYICDLSSRWMRAITHAEMQMPFEDLFNLLAAEFSSGNISGQIVSESGIDSGPPSPVLFDHSEVSGKSK